MLFKQKYAKFFLILGSVIFFATGVIFLHTCVQHINQEPNLKKDIQVKRWAARFNNNTWNV